MRARLVCATALAVAGLGRGAARGQEEAGGAEETAAGTMEAFRVELGAVYSTTSDGVEADGERLTGTVSLARVEALRPDGGIPLDEALFFARTPRVTWTLSPGRSIDHGGGVETEEEGMSVGVLLARKDAPFTAGLLYGNEYSAIPDAVPPSPSATMETLGATFGCFLGPRAEIRLSYEDAELRPEPGFPEDPMQRREIGVSGRALFMRKGGMKAGGTKEGGMNGGGSDGGGAVSVSGSVGLVHTTEGINPERTNLSFALAADHYFNRLVRVGVTFGLTSGDDTPREGRALGARFSLNTRGGKGIRVSYERFTASDPAAGDRATLVASLIIRM